MTNLRIDAQSLRVAASRAREIRSRFAAAQNIAYATAELTGHDGLANKVREFADAWDVSRARLTERLEHVAESLQAVTDTFELLDGELRDAVGEIDARGSSGGGGV